MKRADFVTVAVLMAGSAALGSFGAPQAPVALAAPAVAGVPLAG